MAIILVILLHLKIKSLLLFLATKPFSWHKQANHETHKLKFATGDISSIQITEQDIHDDFAHLNVGSAWNSTIDE